MATKQEFQTYLAEQYRQAFETDQDFAYVRNTCTPDVLAERMTNALAKGSANKGSKVISRTLKHFGIKNTWRDIETFFGTSDIAG